MMLLKFGDTNTSFCRLTSSTMKKMVRFGSEISKDRLGSDPGNGTERDKNAHEGNSELPPPFITCHQRVLSHIKISKPLRFCEKHGKPGRQIQNSHQNSRRWTFEVQVPRSNPNAKPNPMGEKKKKKKIEQRK